MSSTSNASEDESEVQTLVLRVPVDENNRNGVLLVPRSSVAVRPMQVVVVHGAIPTALYRRFQRLADYGNRSEGLFSLTRVPEDVRWYNACESPILSVDDDPMGLRVVGSVMDVGEGEDARGVFIDIDPLRAIDHEGMHRMYEMARPAPAELAETMRLHWIPETEGDYAKEVVPVYDATHRLRPAAFMETMPFSELKVGDVVVADCVVYKSQHRYGWDVVFSLVTVAVLAQVPRQN
ncbi:uncharacterized protein TRAVEDRAFT_22653 [Trametes versicolor FP-101664 SS1]|uniref:uncharacterized protein n=1 Tax=Trametes versicolor (strain FP-101664) TaxID=717944 RepID=UPI0004621550|nr:uncharacterized protein TRAVEDRAFT_22653 [Trametes versicolor FP-101664 SS1]EIW54756.1 hypothetical protein TRAVEDRAFT_22653 [Trametes versicolor FP-101664 SS1]